MAGFDFFHCLCFNNPLVKKIMEDLLIVFIECRSPCHQLFGRGGGGGGGGGGGSGGGRECFSGLSRVQSRERRRGSKGNKCVSA